MIYMEVNPIKNLKDIEKIKRYLLKMDNKRNYCLFVVGINVGLRISDLLSLKLNDVFNFKEWKAKDEFIIKIFIFVFIIIRNLCAKLVTSIKCIIRAGHYIISDSNTIPMYI